MTSVSCFMILATVFLSSQPAQTYMIPSSFTGSLFSPATYASDQCIPIAVHGQQSFSSRSGTLLSTRGSGRRPAPLVLQCKSAVPRPGGGQRKAAAAPPPLRKRPPPPVPPPKPLVRRAASPAPARATAAERLQWAATPAAILDAFERSPLTPRLLSRPFPVAEVLQSIIID